MKRIKNVFALIIAFVVVLSAAGCGSKKPGIGENTKTLTGNIKIDGSSTVGPITQAISEEFTKAYPGVNTSVGISGTGGGFKKFTVGETDINDASRKVEKSELDTAKKNGIDMTEFEIAYDGIAVVVNKDNNWVSDITTAELKKIWEKDSKVKLWSDVRPEWPKQPIKLYGPGTDSGTFEYFTEAINGKAKSIRGDFSASVDPNTLVQGISGDKYAMGYFGVAYFEENADKLKLLKVNGVAPSLETVKGGTYKPLSRPLFIYVANKSMERPEVKEFVKFYINNAKSIVGDVGYFPLDDSKYQEGLNKIK